MQKFYDEAKPHAHIPEVGAKFSKEYLFRPSTLNNETWINPQDRSEVL